MVSLCFTALSIPPRNMANTWQFAAPEYYNDADGLKYDTKRVSNKPITLQVIIRSLATGLVHEYTTLCKISAEITKRRHNTITSDPHNPLVVMVCTLPGINNPTATASTASVHLTPSNDKAFLYTVITKGGTSQGRPAQQYTLIRRGSLYTITTSPGYVVEIISIRTIAHLYTPVVWHPFIEPIRREEAKTVAVHVPFPIHKPPTSDDVDCDDGTVDADPLPPPPTIHIIPDGDNDDDNDNDDNSTIITNSTSSSSSATVAPSPTHHDDNILFQQFPMTPHRYLPPLSPLSPPTPLPQFDALISYADSLTDAAPFLLKDSTPLFIPVTKRPRRVYTSAAMLGLESDDDDTDDDHDKENVAPPPIKRTRI
jgi:hypothetical protein